MKIKSLLFIAIFCSCRAFAQSDSSFCSLFRAVLANHEIVTYMDIDTAHLENMKLLDRDKHFRKCIIDSRISVVDTSGRFILFTPHYYDITIDKNDTNETNETIIHIYHPYQSNTVDIYLSKRDGIWFIEKYEFGKT